MHERGAEHLKAFKDKDIEKSVMLKHSHDKHEGNFVQFNMKIIKKHSSILKETPETKIFPPLIAKVNIGGGIFLDLLLMNQKMFKLIEGMI